MPSLGHLLGSGTTNIAQVCIVSSGFPAQRNIFDFRRTAFHRTEVIRTQAHCPQNTLIRAFGAVVGAFLAIDHCGVGSGRGGREAQGYAGEEDVEDEGLW